MANAIGGGTPIPTTKVVPAQNVTPVETNRTLNVRLKNFEGDGDGEAIIAEHDFDPELHEKLNEDGEPDEKAKATKFIFREVVVEPDLDDNDLKELGPPKTKQEKDRLENQAKTALANPDQQKGQKKLRSQLEEVVGPDAMQGQQNLPPQMQPTKAVGPGVTNQTKGGEEKTDSKPTDKSVDEANKKAAAALDEKLPTRDKTDSPPLTPRK